jgi:lysozyme family protein
LPWKECANSPSQTRKEEKKVSQVQTIPLTLTQPRNEIVLFFLRKINKKNSSTKWRNKLQNGENVSPFCTRVFLMVFFKQ